MKLTRIHIRTALIYSLVVVLSCSHPMIAMADDGTATSSATTTAQETSTTPSPNYTYDPTTEHWNSDQWYYDSNTGKYEPVPDKTSTAEAVTAPTNDSSNPPLAQSSAEATSGGPEATATATSTAVSTMSSSSAISTSTTSSAQSGDASVTNNTTAGDATTGSAQAADTLINTVNSSTGGSGIVSFTSNVSGDVNGDIQLYPMILSAMASRGIISTPDTSQAVTGAITTTNTSGITNDVNLSATSGAATVDGNTSAGSATSGSANTVVNVMNLVNSMVAASQSFLGIINIYGNLNGNILLAPDFIPQLIASNAGTTNPTSITVDNNSLIKNNISLNATSGAATVDGNTSAGSATSGTATTNIVLLNLSGHQVVASNSLLVFVNVLGKWVGVIVDAPAGSTAAVIGSGVSQNDVSTITTPVVVNNDTRITNNIQLSSQSGDASVINNTSAGGATSGNATASANVLNMTQSYFGLSGWFGALFINVFGSWLGSFGISPIVATTPTTGGVAYVAPETAATVQSVPVVRFVSQPAVLHIATSSEQLVGGASQQTATSSMSPVESENDLPAVLGTSSTNSTSDQAYNTPVVLGVIVIALSLVGAAIGRRLWIARQA